MEHVINHFKKVDPILASAITKIDPIFPGKDYFSDLCKMIIQQQLSGAAGDSIWNRFLKLIPHLTPLKLLAVSDKDIRAVGISWSKITYLKNLAQYAKQFDLTTLRIMPDQDVIAELTKIKGIGPWTAEMFLMFTLGREDVFSYGDLGLRNAIKKLYKFKSNPTRKQMDKLVNRWSPYRTYAALILWKSLEV
jgi:DNA-3-methyladenine glycosylase II